MQPIISDACDRAVGPTEGLVLALGRNGGNHGLGAVLAGPLQHRVQAAGEAADQLGHSRKLAVLHTGEGGSAAGEARHAAANGLFSPW